MLGDVFLCACDPDHDFTSNGCNCTEIEGKTNQLPYKNTSQRLLIQGRRKLTRYVEATGYARENF